MPRATTPSKRSASDAIFAILVAITTALILTTIYWVFERAPTEKVMGIVQKIFYFHVPSAYSMYIGATACFVGSAGYLVKPSAKWDALGRAGAEL
ncbi:MAG: cytochrome c biogenesis protein, partial [Polyangiaceae bacterium]